MKLLIEVSGGVVTNIVATESASIYLIDHDNLKERDEGGVDDVLKDVRMAMEPYSIIEPDEEFMAMIDETLDEYREEGGE
jgi:hypothetical protein